MTKLKTVLYLLATLALVVCGVVTMQGGFAYASSSAPKAFVTFPTFLVKVQNAHYSDYAGLPTTRVRNEQAFTQMRSYILDMYRGVQEVNSYVQDGQYFDCIVVNSQPTVRHLHI